VVDTPAFIEHAHRALADLLGRSKNHVNPQMAYWGGPTGVGDPQGCGPDPYNFFGSITECDYLSSDIVQGGARQRHRHRGRHAASG